MIAKAITPDTLLRDFFEKRYRPDKLRRASYQVLDPFPRTINWLQRFLRRAPKISDLTFDNVQRLQSYLEDRGRSVYSIRKVGRRLGDLWRYAHQLGAAPPCRSIPYATGRIRTPRLAEHTGAPCGTFERHYLKVLRPQLTGKSQGYVEFCDTVVSRFTLYRGTFTSLPELGDRLIDDFRQWLIDIGNSPTTATNYCGGLRRIVRMIDDKLCRPPMQAWRKKSREEPPVGSLRHFYLTAYKPLRMIGATEGSMEQIELAIDRMNQFVGREVMAAELSDELLAGFMRWMLDAGNSAVTANGRRASICALWRFAKRRGLIATLPDVPKLREDRPEPDAWSLTELGEIIAACSEQPGMIGPLRASDFLIVVAYLGYYTAIRRGTMLELKPSHLNLKTGVLDIPPSIMKNRRGKKFILPGDALDAVRAIYSPSRPLLLPIPWKEPRPLYDRWRKVLKQVDLPVDRRQCFHKLRRTGATAAAVQGGMYAAMVLLGHSEQYITDRYVDPTKIPGLNVTAMLPSPTLPKAAGRATA